MKIDYFCELAKVFSQPSSELKETIITAGEKALICMYRLGKIFHYLGKRQTNCNKNVFTAMHFSEVPSMATEKSEKI